MSRFFNRKSIIFALVALALIAGFFGTVVLRGSATNSHAAAPKAHSQVGKFDTSNPQKFCDRVKSGQIQVSSGARMYCYGPQNGNGSPTAGHNKPGTKRIFGTNADAANPAEDVAPNGTLAYGQSEVSVAGVGPYVVEAWNDATGFFSPCPSPGNKEELTGYGFSANNGKSFTDEGGLPNAACATNILDGDPSVEAWAPGGQATFYVSSLYPSSTGLGPNYLAINACRASGTGASAIITCGQPIILAAPSECLTFVGFTFCSFLDKEFLSIDPVRGRLYASYTEFGFVTNPDTIELAVCDIGTPTGGTGPTGGTALNPVCHNGAEGIASGTGTAPPYFVVAPSPANGCENEGAYPAVDLATGDVYVAFEHNWASNLTAFGPCATDPVLDVMNYTPFACLTLPTASCGAPAATNAVSITSMDSAFVPGYNRFPANDFPRIAVSDPAGTVSMVWNDARYHPLGDILLQSFSLVSLTGIQPQPVRVNNHVGGLHFLPALRNVDDDGDLQVSYYERATGSTTLTNVYAVIDLSPLATSTPGTSVLVTTAPTNWLGVSSDIIPNFGDYTDNYVQAQQAAPYTTQLLYVAWSDGRIGDPQPFEAPGHTN